MNIYLVGQSVNEGYDTYDNFVVVCENENDAAFTRPDYCDGDEQWDGKIKTTFLETWCDAKDVIVKLIGTTDLFDKKQVICASFNAG